MPVLLFSWVNAELRSQLTGEAVCSRPYTKSIFGLSVACPSMHAVVSKVTL